jgi:hypothetical protein
VEQKILFHRECCPNKIHLEDSFSKYTSTLSSPHLISSTPFHNDFHIPLIQSRTSSREKTALWTEIHREPCLRMNELYSCSIYKPTVVLSMIV